MAFAGDTMWAYPIIAQTVNSIRSFEPSRERRYDLLEARGHALRVINDMVGRGDAIEGPDQPDRAADFLFGGYSAAKCAFRIWRFFYSSNERCYKYERVRPLRIGTFAFIGDVGKAARRRLGETTGEFDGWSGPLDMQPFEVIRDLLREGNHETIGGPPQIVKCYRHMNTEAFAVDWSPDPDNVQPQPALLGRPLLEYEQLGVPQIQADAPTATWR